MSLEEDENPSATTTNIISLHALRSSPKPANATLPLSPTQSHIPEMVANLQQVRVKGSPPPQQIKIENLAGGYDYVFNISARNSLGFGSFVASRKISPTAVVVAKTKDELPIIFQRFGIDLSGAENVKVILDILWNRYEKQEFYMEVRSFSGEGRSSN